jgi:hypothetical protein
MEQDDRSHRLISRVTNAIPAHILHESGAAGAIGAPEPENAGWIQAITQPDVILPSRTVPRGRDQSKRMRVTSPISPRYSASARIAPRPP